MVNAWTPAATNWEKHRGLMPDPPAAFSALAMTKSIDRAVFNRGRADLSTLRPGSPTTSPRKRIRKPKPRNVIKRNIYIISSCRPVVLSPWLHAARLQIRSPGALPIGLADAIDRPG